MGENDDLRRRFDEFDTNKDGVIDEAEFTALVAALGLRLTAGEIFTAFMAIDVDGNRSIEFGEFRSWWTKLTRS